jgi:hypothetical protein
MYLGDIPEDAVIDFVWQTQGANGASILPSVAGTISVYKGNNSTPSTSGVTDDRTWNSVTGVHHCRIDTSSHAFYAPGNDYHVVLSGATIDGQAVNARLASFSIDNRPQKVDVTKWKGAIAPAMTGDAYAAVDNVILYMQADQDALGHSMLPGLDVIIQADSTTTVLNVLASIATQFADEDALVGRLLYCANSAPGDPFYDENTGCVRAITANTAFDSADAGTITLDAALPVAPGAAGGTLVYRVLQANSSGSSTALAGITSLAAWLRAIVRKDTPDPTALAEINTGGGAYSASAESAEAISAGVAQVLLDLAAVSYTVGVDEYNEAGEDPPGIYSMVAAFESGDTFILQIASPPIIGALAIQPLRAYRYAGFAWTGIPFATSQTGGTLKFCVTSIADKTTILWSLDATHITIAGDGLSCNITDTDAYTTTTGEFFWFIHNTTTDRRAAEGTLRIEDGPNIT